MVVVAISHRSVAPALSTVHLRLVAPMSNSRSLTTSIKQRLKCAYLAKSPSRHLWSILKHPSVFGECQRRFASSAKAGETDPYKILGVDRNASADEIKKAYRREALKWHPDRHPDEKRKDAEARFGAIANAYETLSDPGKKQQFDQAGQAGGFPSGPGGGFPGGFQQPQGGFHSQADAERLFREVFGGQSMDDIFREFLGRSASRSPQTLQLGAEVQILPDRQSVLAACRQCGIDSTNDNLRVRCLGRQGRIIKTDPRDQSVKIKVDGVGDVWFGAAGVRPAGGPGFPGHAQFFEGFGNFGGFGGEGLSGGGVVQMRQEIVTKPNGQRVVRVTRVVRGADGSLHEDVSESPLQ